MTIDQNRLNLIAADLKLLRPGLGKLELAYELTIECRLRGLHYNFEAVKTAVHKVLEIQEARR
jgi:hypothetical protein